MDASLVLTILGPDRPGLVEAVSQTIAEHGGSWQESSMARLAGRFAGVLLVSIDEARAEALTTALRGLESAGLSVVVERSSETEADAGQGPRGHAGYFSPRLLQIATALC